MHDPRLGRLAASLSAIAPREYARSDELVEAAVALVLRPGTDPGADLEVLLIERSRRSDDPWSGHMALPGGRRDADDADLLTTALRETREEVGIELDPAAHVLGPLDEVRPASRHLPPLVIRPYVALAPSGQRARPDGVEVADALWAPVEALRARDAASEVFVPLDGTRVGFPSYRYRDKEIWGLTHRILGRFFELLPETT